MSGFTPPEKKAVLALVALYSTRMLGLFMVLPVLALFASDLQGSTPLLVGVAMGAYGLSQGILQIPFGILSDRFGRKPMILAGLLLFLAGSILAALSPTITGVIAGRLLQGMGAISGVVMALVADLTAAENRTRAMAFIGASIGLSFAIAMVTGPVLASHGGIAAIFWVTAGLAVLGIWVTITVIPGAAVTMPAAGGLATPSLLRNTLLDAALIRLYLGIFTVHFVLMSVFLIIPVILRDQLGYPTHQHGLVYLGMFAGSFLVMLPLMLAAEKYGKTRSIFLASIAVYCITLSLLPKLRGSSEGLLAGLFVFFMAFNVLEAMLPSLVSKTCAPEMRGTAMGIYATFQFAGAFLGGGIGGWLLGRQGSGDTLFYVAAALALLWFCVAFFMSFVPVAGQAGKLRSGS